MASESIIKTAKCCFFCGSEYQLERHHCIKGRANRKLAEADGLWIYLCSPCHRELHGMRGHEKDETLKQTAEWAWLEHNGHIDREKMIPTEEGISAWIKRYGKSFL